MNIGLINGSPKAKNSSSGIVLDNIKKLLPEEYLIHNYNFRTQKIDNIDLKKISEANTLILAFPLYVDGIPSHLLYCLEQMEEYFKISPNPKISIYAIVNCGFYEGRQGEVALEMMENWCRKAGLNWGQGISIGCGGMLSMLSNIPEGQGPWKDLGGIFRAFSKNIIEHKSADNILVTPNIPRFMYKMGGHVGWRKAAKKHGLNIRDLSRRIN